MPKNDIANMSPFMGNTLIPIKQHEMASKSSQLSSRPKQRLSFAGLSRNHFIASYCQEASDILSDGLRFIVVSSMSLDAKINATLLTELAIDSTAIDETMTGAVNLGVKALTTTKGESKLFSPSPSP
jgi:hypothetical protein